MPRHPGSAPRPRAPHRRAALRLVLLAGPLAAASAQERPLPPAIGEAFGPVPASELPELAKAAAPERPVAERLQAYQRIARVEPAADRPEREQLLLQGLRAEHESLRLQCAQALGRLVPEPRVAAVVAALTAALDDDDPAVVSTAASALARYGPAAEAALPRLGELLRGGPRVEPPASRDGGAARWRALGIDLALQVRTAAAGARAAIGGAEVDVEHAGELDPVGREAWVMAMTPVIEGGLSQALLAANQASPPSPSLQARYVELLGAVVRDAAERAEQAPAHEPLGAGARLRSHVGELVKALLRFAALPGAAPAESKRAKALIEGFAGSDLEILRATVQALQEAGRRRPR